jgi:tripartite-type tricarboxylate transporter receptor subunit TctC
MTTRVAIVGIGMTSFGKFMDRSVRTSAEEAVRNALADAGIGAERVIGLVAPKNLDPKIAARLGAAFRKATTDPAYLKQLDQFDMQPNVMNGEVYTAYAKAQFEREGKMLSEIGFKQE